MNNTLYEHDLAAVGKFVEAIAPALKSAGGLEQHYVLRAEITLWHADDYAVGTLIYEDEQVRFEIAEAAK